MSMQPKNPQRQIIELEHENAILTKLAEISTVVNSTLRLKPLLAHIMDAAADITNAEAASVLMLDRKTNQLRFTATTTGVGDNLIGKLVPLDRSIAGAVLLERRIVIVNDVRTEPGHYNKLDEENAFQTRSILAVPMKSKNRIIGVIEAINRRKLPWTNDDVRYLSILAAQAAVAIEGTQLVTRLERANQELSELDQLKSDFIAIASHELRTPLGVILGYASFLQETNDQEVNEHASKVVNSALQLRRIIEDLTNLRYLQENQTDFQIQTITMDELIADVMNDEIQMLAKAKGHRLTTQIAPGLRVSVDRSRMAMGIMNLVVNAMRFTPDGGDIRIRAEMTPSREVMLSLKDNGIGIAREELERIFDKFYQVENHMIRHHGGLGIGLSITQALVKAHGGRIWAESEGLGRGSTFYIVLPAAS